MPALVPKHSAKKHTLYHFGDLGTGVQEDAVVGVGGHTETQTRNIIMRNSTAVGPIHVTMSGQVPQADGTVRFWKWEVRQHCPQGRAWAYLSQEQLVDTPLSNSQGFLCRRPRNPMKCSDEGSGQTEATFTPKY